MSTIMIVDDQLIFLELLQMVLKHDGYETACFTDGHEALNSLVHIRPDLILLDVVMPGMDGLAFLNILRNNPQQRDIPVILLTAVAERGQILRAAKLGISDYLLKSKFSLKELLNRIHVRLNGKNGSLPPERKTTTTNSIAAPAQNVPSCNSCVPPNTLQESSTIRQGMPILIDKASRREALTNMKPIIKKQELIHLVNKGLELSPLAPTIQQVMSISLNPECTAEDIAKAVGQDQALAIRILKVSNSSIYSRGRSLQNVREAVSRLGIQEIRRLAITLSVMEQYEGRISKHVDSRHSWEHSIACGVIASLLGQKYDTQNKDDYFTWGLLHDIGRLILLEHVTELYADTIETSNTFLIPLEVAEKRLLMVDHCDILARILQHWNFTWEFITPVVNHHKSVEEIKRLGTAYVESAAIIALANRLSHAMLCGSSGNHILYSFEEHANLLGIPSEELREIMSRVPDEINAMKITLLTHGKSDIWVDYPTHVQQKFKRTIYPLCIHPNPDYDALQIFFNHLSNENRTQTPNLGIIYCPDARQQMELFTKYQALERNATQENLPLLLVCNKGQLDLQQSWLSQRKKMVIEWPTHINLLVDTINWLVE